MKKQYGYIYKTTNILNGMVYIGQSKRWELMDSYYGSGDYFTKAFKEYGKENFTKIVLHEAETREELDYYELLEIAKMRVNDEKTYNGHFGGPRGTTIIMENILRTSGLVNNHLDTIGEIEEYYSYLKDNKDEVISIINDYYNNLPTTEEFYAGLEKELLISQDLRSDCGYCDSKSGSVCRTKTGNPTSNHASRNARNKEKLNDSIFNIGVGSHIYYNNAGEELRFNSEEELEEAEYFDQVMSRD